MKKRPSKSGFTLIELIVSSLLVVIIVLGIFSINNVLNNNNQDFGQRYLVRSETQSTLNHILNNAAQAIGSGTTDNFGNLDLGIVYGTAGTGDDKTLCIHQDPNNTPTNYIDDQWLCYTWFPNTDQLTPNQILYCTYPFLQANSANSYRGAQKCINTNPGAGTYLGTAYSNPFLPSSTTFTATGNQMLLSVSIKNCLDNTAPTITAGGRGTCDNAAANTSSDEANNPEVVISGSVFPEQEGMQQS